MLARFLVAAALAALPLHAQEVQNMPPTADPSFEVATIKPADPNNPGKDFYFEGRIFRAVNYNVEDLLALGYGLHAKQIAGEPAWFASTLYDIEGVPDTPGRPSMQQKFAMIQKLLADRFHLVFHYQKRELPIYAITIAKDGPKLTASTAGADDPGRFQWQHRLGDLRVTNLTIAEFAIWFQKTVTDKPLVDRTGLTARYDFGLTWTPGESEFPQFRRTGGFNPGPTDGLDGAKAAPSLNKALEEQLGLRLESVRAPIEIMVIDHADRPSPN
ncbi:MAG: TIGR03435 family protein [Acidobacteriota bacterium]|nr:TIGR03435 family protein [Acidobacteriota bacterium]